MVLVWTKATRGGQIEEQAWEGLGGEVWLRGRRRKEAEDGDSWRAEMKDWGRDESSWRSSVQLYSFTAPEFDSTNGDTLDLWTLNL